MTLLYITVPFVALAITFLALGKLTGGGWDALDYLVYAMATGLLWAAVVVCYLVWVVIRDGWQISSVPAAVVLTVLVLMATGWGYRKYAEEADCRAAQAFYARLATMPATARPATIREGDRFVRTGTDCAVDGLRAVLGRHILDPEPSNPSQDTERRAILAELLDAGLPPDYRVLYGFAVSDADPVSTRLLLRRRKILNTRSDESWSLFPDDIVQPLITRARTVAGTGSDPHAERYRETLAVFVEEGQPDPASLSSWTRDMLAGLGLLAGKPPGN